MSPHPETLTSHGDIFANVPGSLGLPAGLTGARVLHEHRGLATSRPLPACQA